MKNIIKLILIVVITGAMFFGDIEEQIQFSEESLWAGHCKIYYIDKLLSKEMDAGEKWVLKF
jgi:hypothetical protein